MLLVILELRLYLLHGTCHETKRQSLSRLERERKEYTVQLEKRKEKIKEKGKKKGFKTGLKEDHLAREKKR